MNNTSYIELADAVFNKIKDNDFLTMTKSIAYRIVIDYIRSAIVNFENSKQDLSNRDDILQEFNFVLTDNTFVILVNYMVIEWLTSNYILTFQALKARMSSTEFHKVDTKDMLGKTTELREKLKSENDQLAINKSYKHSNLFSIAIRKKV